MIWLQTFMKEQQNTLLAVIVVLLTLVPIEVASSTVPAITQPTATTVLPLTAMTTMGLGSAYICSSER